MSDPVRNFKFTVTVEDSPPVNIPAMKVTGLSEINEYKFLRLTRAVINDEADQYLLTWFRSLRARRRNIVIQVPEAGLQFTLTGIKPGDIIYEALDAGDNGLLLRVFEFEYDTILVTP